MAMKAKKRINVANTSDKAASVSVDGKFALILNPRQIKSLKREEGWVIAELRANPPLKVAIGASEDELEDLLLDIPMR